MEQREPSPLALPTEPVDRLIAPFERFLHVEAAGGIVLLACTVVALTIANSPLGEAYHQWWHTPVAVEFGAFQLRKTLEHWINDGLMTLFFFVVGLEVKRELVLGELRDPRAAALPIAGAIGGMIVPAGIYLVLIGSSPAARGWGIPMATDIAFVVGCMAVLGRRVPHGLRVMLLSLAIADDIGAILVIALGYSAGIVWLPLCLGVLGLGLVVLFEHLGVRSFGVYTLLGAAIWVAFVKSGVHATIAGVILGLLTPARPYLSQGALASFLERARSLLHGGGWSERDGVTHARALRRASRQAVSPLEYLEHLLHPWVSFAIMPIFALANAGVHVDLATVGDRVTLAVAAGLLAGKPLGIVATSWLAVAAGAARLPAGVTWAGITGGSVLCGIGFTMALFVASLALEGAALAAAKVGVLIGSALAAAAGMLVLLGTAPSSSAATARAEGG
jgi:NhaA family Na+:H+ antiporter